MTVNAQRVRGAVPAPRPRGATWRLQEHPALLPHRPPAAACDDEGAWRAAGLRWRGAARARATGTAAAASVGRADISAGRIRAGDLCDVRHLPGWAGA